VARSISTNHLAAHAGAVNVIYGSKGGLTAKGTDTPANQFWSQGRADVLDDADAGDLPRAARPPVPRAA
jgi:hypothetical protein